MLYGVEMMQVQGSGFLKLLMSLEGNATCLFGSISYDEVGNIKAYANL